jgi:hypothetical protein
MTYRHDGATYRECAICERAIRTDDWMLDLFRTGSGNVKVEWVHENCARDALEVFLQKKRERLRKEKISERI